MVLEDLSPGSMTDTGMWIWAGIVTLVSLLASLGVAIWWQRRKEKARSQD